jgi:nucleoside phosphorylase
VTISQPTTAELLSKLLSTARGLPVLACAGYSDSSQSRPGASQATIRDALDNVAPRSVLLVGIAFGIDSTNQKLGTVLVSQRLQAYELAKIATDENGKPSIIARGDRTTASVMLLGRFRAAEANWNSASSVKFGLMLSGEKLIDNLEFRQQLQSIAPEAIGGEMEGAGAYAACAEEKTDWIVVKAICDFADGDKKKNKKARQENAADQAASFVFHALSQGGFG